MPDVRFSSTYARTLRIIVVTDYASTLPLRSRVRLELQFQPDSAWNRSHNLHEAYQLPCVQWITPDDGHRSCPKHVGFYDKNKFWILMRLVGCFYETYHDARSPEHKVLPSYLVQIAQLFI